MASHYGEEENNEWAQGDNRPTGMTRVDASQGTEHLSRARCDRGLSIEPRQTDRDRGGHRFMESSRREEEGAERSRRSASGGTYRTSKRRTVMARTSGCESIRIRRLRISTK